MKQLGLYLRLKIDGNFLPNIIYEDEKCLEDNIYIKLNRIKQWQNNDLEIKKKRFVSQTKILTLNINKLRKKVIKLNFN